MDPKPTPRELAQEMAAKSEWEEQGAPTAEAAEAPAVPTRAEVREASRERVVTQLTPELEARGLTAEDIPGATLTTPEGQEAPPEEPVSDPVRSTQQFQHAAQQLALTGLYKADQIAAMLPEEVFRLGQIAADRNKESALLRQQLAEAKKPGEQASAPEGGDAVPDPVLVDRLREKFQPVFESMGEAEGEKMVQAALSEMAPVIPTTSPVQPAHVTPEPTAQAEAARMANLSAQMDAARVELRESFPQLASDASMRAVADTADALAMTHTFASVKEALEAGAMALFGQPVVQQAQENVARVQEEAARKLGTPQPPPGAQRNAVRDPELTPEQIRFQRFNETADLVSSGREDEVRGRLGT